MIPPRRASAGRRQSFEPNEAPRGLNQLNEGSYRDERESDACKVYENTLKKKNWRGSGNGRSLEDWVFLPGSLKQYPKSYIIKNGTEGVHYALGWLGLWRMLDRYGEDYAPTLNALENNNPTPASQVTPPDTSSDEDTVAFGSPAVAGETRNEDEDETMSVAVNDDDDVEAFVDDIEEEAPAVMEEEQQDQAAENPTNIGAPPALAPLGDILASMKSCRDEIESLQTDESFNTEQERAAYKEQMKRTLALLYTQLGHYTNNNST